MVIQNEQALSESSQGLRDVNPAHNEGNLNDIKTGLDTQKRYLVLIGKFQELCIKFAERNTLEDLKKAHVFAKCVFKMEAELKALILDENSDLARKYLDSYEREIEAVEVANATYLATKKIAKVYVQLKENGRKGGLMTKKNANEKQTPINDICIRYSDKHPDRLCKEYCKSPAKADIIRLIMETVGVGDTTAKERRKLAFAELGFPEIITK